MKKRVAVLGGGFSGLAAAEHLLKNNFDVTLFEKYDKLGGVASNFSLPDGRIIPRTYHHIVGTDRHLREYLEYLEIINDVQWSSIDIKFYLNGAILDLSNPFDLLVCRELSPVDKMRFVYFGLRCLIKPGWDDVSHLSVKDIVLRWGNERVYEKIFRPLIDIKYGLSPEEMSASWLGMRLHKREAKTKFGYIPNESWTERITDCFKDRIGKDRGTIITGAPVQEIHLSGNEVYSITAGDKKYSFDYYLSTIWPPELKKAIRGDGFGGALEKVFSIQYISSYNIVAGVDTDTFDDYWTIPIIPRKVFGSCFRLDRLNPTLLKGIDKSVINCFQNVPYEKYQMTDEDFIEQCRKDLSDMIGRTVTFNWTHLSKINGTSPIFDRDYANPPVHAMDNLFLSGIYTTYPELSSTGTALNSGRTAAQKIIDQAGTQ